MYVTVRYQLHGTHHNWWWDKCLWIWRANKSAATRLKANKRAEKPWQTKSYGQPPPFSSDCASSDFFLFSKLKFSMILILSWSSLSNKIHRRGWSVCRKTSMTVTECYSNWMKWWRMSALKTSIQIVYFI